MHWDDFDETMGCASHINKKRDIGANSYKVAGPLGFERSGIRKGVGVSFFAGVQCYAERMIVSHKI